MRVAAALSPILVLIACCCPRIAIAHAATSNTVLFDREIVRILDAHCVMCHAEGGPTFALETYEQTWLKRHAIHDETLARHMPPWAAVEGYGEFANANRLTLREQRFIVSWVEGLGPRNTGVVFLNVLDADAAPHQEVRADGPFDTWTLGEPDQTIELPRTRVEASRLGYPLRVHRTIVDPGSRSERRLSALEYRPGDRRSTRAAVFTIESTGQWLATWTPWYGFRRLPENMAYRLVAGDEIVAEIYTAEGNEILDEPGWIGLHFADGRDFAEPGHPDGAGVAAPADIAMIAAGEVPGAVRQHRLQAETQLGADTTVLALWPSPTTGIESIEVRATRPDGGVEILLFASDIPLDWPTPYICAEPVRLPRGTRVALTAYASNAGSVTERRQLEVTLSVLEH